MAENTGSRAVINITTLRKHARTGFCDRCRSVQGGFIVTAKEKALDYKDIGLRIKTLRIKNNIYQTELAKDIGVSQTHMSNIESGRAGITLENLVKMAEVFKCGIDEIIYGLRPQHEDKSMELLKSCTMEDVLQALQMLQSIKR